AGALRRAAASPGGPGRSAHNSSAADPSRGRRRSASGEADRDRAAAFLHQAPQASFLTECHALTFRNGGSDHCTFRARRFGVTASRRPALVSTATPCLSSETSAIVPSP